MLHRDLLRLSLFTLLLCTTQVACTSKDPPADSDSALDTQDTAEDSDPGDSDTQETELPEDWPESWGVLSLNLHCLRTDETDFSSNTERFEAIAQEVAERDIVALALQEVCVRDGGEDALAMLLSAIEEGTGKDWSGLWSFAHVAWEGTKDEAREGLGLIALGGLDSSIDTHYFAQSALTRTLLGATLDNGMRLFTVHLDHQDDTARELQARELATIALASSDPVLDILVAGDFNDDSRSSALWAQTGTGFIEDSTAQDDPRDHILHHRAARVEMERSSYLFDGVEGPVVSDHHGIGVWYGAGTGQQTCTTRIHVQVALAEQEQVTLRGTDFPLDWSFGLPTWPVAGGSLWVSTEIEDAPFEYKALLNDSTWQTGENQVGQGCADHVDIPVWETPKE